VQARLEEVEEELSSVAGATDEQDVRAPWCHLQAQVGEEHRWTPGAPMLKKVKTE